MAKFFIENTNISPLRVFPVGGTASQLTIQNIDKSSALHGDPDTLSPQNGNKDKNGRKIQGEKRKSKNKRNIKREKKESRERERD